MTATTMTREMLMNMDDDYEPYDAVFFMKEEQCIKRNYRTNAGDSIQCII